MKLIFLLTFLVSLGSACVCAQGSNLKASELKPLDIQAVTNFFSAYDRGVFVLRDLYGQEQACLRKEIIRYYNSATNQLSADHQYVVSACMLKENTDWEIAAQLAEKYVQANSNRVGGWVLLGTASLQNGNQERGVEAYEIAVALGDIDCVSALSATALTINRLDIVRKHVPDLLALKKTDKSPLRLKQEVVMILTAYAVRIDDEGLFIKATEDVDMQSIISRKDAVATLDIACKKFRSPKMTKFCEKIDEALKETTKATN